MLPLYSLLMRPTGYDGELLTILTVEFGDAVGDESLA